MKKAKSRFAIEFQNLCARHNIKAFALAVLEEDEETLSSLHGEVYEVPEGSEIEHDVLTGQVANALIEWLKAIGAPIKFD